MPSKWDIPKFKKLCSSVDIPYPRTYTLALLRKMELINYHSKRALEVWRELFKRHSKISITDSEWIKTEIASEAHATAMASHLHSMADIMAQIVNRVVLKNLLKEGKVNINGVAKEVKNKKVKRVIKNLIEDTYFEYVKAFVNTTKHRYLVDREYAFEMRKGWYTQGIRFKGFNYKGKTYDKVWVKDLVTKYKQKIINRIIQIGNALNKYLEYNQP